MDFSRLLSFRGRIRRSEWWLAQLFALTALVATAITVGVTSERAGSDDSWVALPIVAVTFFVGFISLTAAVKRLHDLDQSGWLVLPLMLAGVVPVLGWLILVGVLGVAPGSPGPNRHGLSSEQLDANPFADILYD